MTEPRDDADLQPEEEARIRDFLRSEPRPSVDELARRRVIAAALEEAAPAAPATTHRSRGRTWLAAVAAAVVLLASVGGAIAMTADRGGNEPQLTGADERSVRAAYSGDLGAADAAAIARAALEVTDRPVPAPSVPDGLARCAADVLDGRPLVALASLRYGTDGTPAFAVVVQEPGDEQLVAVIVARDDCRVLSRMDLDR